MIQILLALIAGILTIAAPCILLPLPIILGGSVGQRSRTRPLFITLGFVASFASVALLINFLVQKLGLDPNTLRTGAVLLLALFAAFMIWPTPFEKLMTHMSGLINRAGQTGQSAGNGNLGGFILGVIIGIIWAPCAGPILGSILTLVALEKNLTQASVLLLAYAVGAGIPMLLIAYGGQALTTKVKIIAQYSHRLQQIFGLLLLLLAGAIYFQYDTVIQAKLVEKFPGLGTAIEKNLVHTFSDDKEMRSQETTNDTAPAASNETAKMEKVTLQDLGPAPEFSKGSIWLNLPSGKDSLSLAELKGKVVLVDFWTYSCINCIRTLPYVTKWYDTYKDKGFVVIGVHTPEFAFEKVTTNVATALTRHHIHYPVVQDNDYATWNAYNNQYWPAEYLLDQEGHIVHTHFGEGEYDKTEDSIRQLLGMNTPVAADDGADLSGIRSPEMYFGTSRLQNLIDEQKASPDPKDYSYPKAFEANMFALSGQWQFSPEKITLTKSGGGMRLAFSANKVNIVAGSNQKQTLRVFIDGKEITPVIVEESKLYPLFEGKSGQHTLELQIPEAGFEAFTFTFG